MAKLIKAYCPKSDSYFLYEVDTVNGKDVITNFLPVTKAQYDKLSSNASTTTIHTNLQANRQNGKRVAHESERYSPQTCRKGKPYDFQCAYCKQLQVESFSSGKSLEECVIEVSSPHYDDIGEVLSEMGLSYRGIDPQLSCDLLFLNCGTEDYVDPSVLRSFVENGGILYASDFAISYINDAFPWLLSWTGDTSACHAQAYIEDREIASLIGSRINIFFDLDVWKMVTKHKGEVLMSADIPGKGKQIPIMVKFDIGKGHIFYTSFHNHEVAGKQEKNLLKLFLCKQLGASTKKSVSDVAALLGLNIHA